MKPLIVVVGPTAVGKSALAVQLAKALDGEIVGADSRQIYRYMDIGTAKPTTEERSEVFHHLIDIVEPDEEFTLAQYQDTAYRAIDSIHRRGKIPFLVGGTGLYVRAVVEGLVIPHVPPDGDLRAIMEEKASKEGYQALFADLLAVDSLAAAKIDPRNVRRVIRALEVYKVTGKPFSAFQMKNPPPYGIFTIGLTLPRAALYERIDSRVDQMLIAGLVPEVGTLIAKGYGFGLPSMSGIGYRQISDFLRGKSTVEEAIQLIRYETHRFARQQYTWFRLDNTDIRWLEAQSEVTADALQIVGRYLEGLIV